MDSFYRANGYALPAAPLLERLDAEGFDFAARFARSGASRVRRALCKRTCNEPHPPHHVNLIGRCFATVPTQPHLSHSTHFDL